MTNQVLWVVLAFTLGLGTQAIDSGSATTQSQAQVPVEEPPHLCYRNGTWYNPCPPDPIIEEYNLVPEED